MGAANAKTANSWSSNFGALSRKDPRKPTSADGTRILFRARSNSFDSISTFGMGAQCESPSRTSSLDNLHVAHGQLRSTQSNGKQYMLLDSASVASSTLDGDNREGNPLDVKSTPSVTEPKLKISRTKSDPLSSRSVQGVREGDAFSDDFASLESNGESGRPPSLLDPLSSQEDGPVVTKETRSQSVPGRSILKDPKTSSIEESVSGLRDDPTLLSKLLADCPQITSSVLSKLSPEEWDQVVSFACASLGKSLQLIKKLSDKQSSSETTPSSHCSPQKHVTINDEVSTTTYNQETGKVGMDGATPTQERPRHQKRRKDRPTSLPPVYLREEPRPSWREESEGDHGALLTRSRAHSHEGGYSHRCASESGRHRPHKSDPPSSRPRRKKALKAQRNPNAPVDISLDDNCPGVAKIRRFHRHTHHHSFCSHSGDRGGSSRERRAIRERPWVEDSHGSVSDHKDDKSLHVTLQDMQTAGTALRQSEDIAEQSLASSYHGGDCRKHHRHGFKLKSKHGSIEDEEVECELSLPTVPVEGGEPVLNEGWNELVCSSTSRSGRDSPATDMAVFNLDLNHPSMLAPFRSKKLNNNHTHHRPSEVLLHSHNHYHHIIHHTPS